MFLYPLARVGGPIWVHRSWPVTMSAWCQWLRSAPASAWTGRWRWPGTMSRAY